MYATTRYDVVVDSSQLQFNSAGPLFERYSVTLQGPVDPHWIGCYKGVVAESSGLSRFRLDPAARTVSFTCRAADGPVEVMGVLKRLDDLIERVNGEATGLTSRRPESQPSHTWGS